LAARNRVSRAHVETLPPTALFISSCSASLSLIRNAGFRLSDSGNFGRPRVSFSILKEYPKIIGKHIAPAD
jgi:hypothetical protein